MTTSDDTPVVSAGTDALRIDLNADLGEGFGRWSLGDDAGLMPSITSANIACGFHAGDPSIMRASCASAHQNGVVVGAQVSYPDLSGFGRRFIDIVPAELTDAVLYQIGALETMARASGTVVRYVKPHGALYNAIVHHERQAAAVVEALVSHGGQLPLMGLPGSISAREAHRRGVRFVSEGFADRAYTADGLLVPRTERGAVLTDLAIVTDQALKLRRAGIESICVHGDTPDAVAMAVAVRAALTADGVVVASFL